MTTETRWRLTPRLVVGLVILVLGVLFTLENLGLLLFDARRLFDFWPVVFILIGLRRLERWHQAREWGGALVWIVVGLWLLLYNLHIFTVDLLDMWPVFLILLGGAIVWRTMFPRGRLSRRGGRRHRQGEGDVGADDDSRISSVAVLCGIRRKNSSPSFSGGELTAIMGGCSVDLRQARMLEYNASLEVVACWGGVELQVPRDWTVVSKVSVIMGGFVDKTDRSQADPDKRLIVNGVALMGGVEVTN